MRLSSGFVIIRTFWAHETDIRTAVIHERRGSVRFYPHGDWRSGIPDPVVFQVKRVWLQSRNDPTKIQKERFVLEGRWNGRCVPLLIQRAEDRENA